VRAVIYARVSTDEQANNYSLPTQLEACRQYAAAHDMTIAGEFSDDYTGTVPIERRPEGSKAYAMLNSGEADALIVYRADRMGRPAGEGDEWDIPPLIRALSKLNKEIHTCNRGKIGTSFADLLLAMLDFKMAGDERRSILERVSRGKAAALKSGRLLIAWPPFGYKVIGEKRDALEVVEEEAAIVRQVFGWATRGDNGSGPMSIWGIARKLSGMKVLTHQDKLGYKRRINSSGVWSPNAVSRLLAQTAYIGYYRTVFNGIEYDVPVPPIVSRDVYARAQAMRAENARFSPRNTKRFYLVNGMIRCGCGCNLSYTGATKPSGRRWYLSSGRTALRYTGNRCKGVAVPADEVEAAAIDYVRKAMTSDYFNICLRELARNSSNALVQLRDELAHIQGDLEQCEAEAGRLVGLVVSGDLVKAALDKKAAELDTTHGVLIQKRDAIQAEIDRMALSDDDMTRYKQFRAEVALALEIATPQEMRTILRICRLLITVIGETIIIETKALPFVPPSEPINVRQNVQKRRKC